MHGVSLLQHFGEFLCLCDSLLWVNSHFFIFMHENTLSCICAYFGANFMLVLAKGVCGLVWNSPLMSDAVCGADRCVNKDMALLTPSRSACGSI